MLIGLARPAPCANFSRRSGRNPSEVCVEPQNRQRHYMASPIPKHAKYQPGCGPGNMLLKNFLLLNVIKNPTIIRHIRTPPGDEPWATEPPRKTSSPTARMHHMKWEMNLGQREPRVSAKSMKILLYLIYRLIAPQQFSALAISGMNNVHPTVARQGSGLNEKSPWR